MTYEKALECLREWGDKPKVASEEEIEFATVVDKALEQADKYKWHDIGKNPSDLPKRKGEYLCVWVIPANLYMTRYDIFHFNGNAFTWYNDEIDKYIEFDAVIAWKSIEPFESEVEE